MAAFKGEFATSDLQPLNQIRGAGEQNAEAIFHKREADRGREMGFSATGSANQQHDWRLYQSRLSPAQSART